MLGLVKKRHPLEDQAAEIADKLQRKLTRMGMEHTRTVRGADYEERSIVRFRGIEASPEWVKLRVDVDSLPKGVTTARLKEETVLTDLGHTLGHMVTFEDRDKKQGCWFVVWLQESNGLPTLVRFSDFVKSYPNRAAPLTIPVGVGYEGPRWVDLRKMPHALVAGATGKGKSVWLHAAIASLMTVPRERLQFVMVDLKGGIELGRYKKIPHVGRSSYFRTAPELPAALLALQMEMQRRADAMEDLADDIDAYNRTRPESQRWPYVVLIVEELANAMLSKERVKLPGCKSETVAVATERLLADIAARARATGIHVIATTQSPRSDVISGLIKANFPCRLAFGTASDMDSRVIIDDSRAQGLDQGRLVFMLNADRDFYQAPMLDQDESNALVKKTLRGIRWLVPQTRESRTNDDLLLLLETAHRDLYEVLDIQRLYRAPDIKRRKMAPARITELVGILHADGVAKKPALGRNFRIAVSPGMWRKKYTRRDLVPGQQDGVDVITEPQIIDAQIIDMGTGREPVKLLPEPGGNQADDIRRWDSLGYSRNEMARRLGMRKEDALKLINEVLGTVQAREKDLFDLLVMRPKFNKVGDCRFFSVRTWRASGKKRQMELFTQVKEQCRDADVSRIAQEIIDVLTSSLGQLDQACITHPPRGGSQGTQHLATEIARSVAAMGGMQYFKAFQDREHPEGHHPMLYDRREALELREQPPRSLCILLDDVSTSGTTISECHAALTSYATLFSLVWIYGEVK